MAATTGMMIQEATDYEVMHKRIKEDLHFGDTPRREIPALSQKSVALLSMLGTGSFCEVYSVDIADAEATDQTVAEDSGSESEEEGLAATRSINSRHSCSSVLLNTKPKYAIKRVKKDLKNDTDKGQQAISDTLYEFEILAHIPQHENIVNLVAVNEGFSSDPSFLVLERVSETLNHRLKRWCRSAPYCVTASFFQFRKRSRQRVHQQRSRIEYCGVGVARALHFLHARGIVFRDIKPSNIGFGYDGSVKLFDFGLARRTQNQHGAKRRLTGNTGTARYMAPEVALHEDYSLPADVYSYAILLWEICSLEKPFGDVASVDQLQSCVIQRHRRPSLRKVASPTIRDLLKACWNPNPAARPTFALVLKQVELAAHEAA